MNISGGSVDGLLGFLTSTTTVSGGTLTNGLMLLEPSATSNFVGTGLSYAYIGYGNSTPYGGNIYADHFKVSGTIGGAAKTYNLYLKNANGSNGTANSTQRQFNFVAPVVVPEAGTFALVVPAFGVVFGAVVRRTRK